MTKSLPLLALALTGAGAVLLARGPQDAERHTEQDGEQDLAQALSGAGVQIDVEAGACAVEALVTVTDDLLEYLLVAPHGAAHESLFTTMVDPEVLNAALLALGVQAGSNALWTLKDPPPSDAELRDGASPYEVTLPAGDGFFLYAAWREAEELFFYRVEDLVRDLGRRRSMQRHRWVYLGSRTIVRTSTKEPAFAASVEGNLINIAFFSAGNTLLTAALEGCIQQTVWLPNAWLLPAFQSPVLFVFARRRLDVLPASLRAAVPEVEPEDAGSRWRSGR